MKPHEKPGTETVLLNGEVVDTSDQLDSHGKTGTRFKRLLLVGSFAIVVSLAILTPAHALDMDVFEAIFSSIKVVRFTQRMPPTSTATAAGSGNATGFGFPSPG